MKHLIRMVPCLHTTTDDRDHILEVWDRQTLTERMSRTKATTAEVFIVNIRLKGSWAPALFKGAEDPGIYLEPRTETKKTKAEVLTAGQATPRWTTIARAGHKWGLRVSAEAAEALHNQYRPGTPYLPGRRLERYHVGPVPYGTTRQALARPVRPTSSTGSGCVWLAQAPQEPKARCGP